MALGFDAISSDAISGEVVIPGTPSNATPLCPDPVLWNTYRKYQAGALDLTVNVALLALAAAATVQVTRAPLYVTAPFKRGTQVEQSVNIAATAQSPTIRINPWAEPTLSKKSYLQIDHSPNIAALVVPAVFMPQPLIDLPVIKKTTVQIDQSKNIAVNFQMVMAPLSPEFLATKRAWTQIDHSPNIAVTVVSYVVPPVLDVPISKRNIIQLELFPNIAVNLQTAVIQPTPDPVFTKKSLPTVDVFPNLAILAPAPQIPLIMPIEPWINKRLWPQVDVYQNTAIYAPSDPLLMPRSSIDPAFYARSELDISHYQNLAVSSSIKPIVDDETRGYIPHDDGKRRKSRHIIRNGQILKEAINPSPIPVASNDRSAKVPPELVAKAATVQTAEDEAIVRATISLMFELL